MLFFFFFFFRRVLVCLFWVGVAMHFCAVSHAPALRGISVSSYLASSCLLLLRAMLLGRQPGSGDLGRHRWASMWSWAPVARGADHGLYCRVKKAGRMGCLERVHPWPAHPRHSVWPCLLNIDCAILPDLHAGPAEPRPSSLLANACLVHPPSVWIDAMGAAHRVHSCGGRGDPQIHPRTSS